MQGQEAVLKQPLRLKSARKQKVQKQVSSARKLFADME